MHRAAVFVVLALLVAACTNSGGKSADKGRTPGKGHTPTPDRLADSVTDPANPTAGPSTTASSSGRPVTGRELLQATRARFTRPLPTVVAPPVTVPGSAATTTTTEPPGPGGPKEPPGFDNDRTSQELIAAAFQDGKISYSQFLLYRAYALFWDPRLPAAYDGTGSTGEDDFFTEARLQFGLLDAQTQTALAPFLERPASPQGYGCPLKDNGQAVSWQDSGTASAHFKVWACGTNGAADDIAAVVAVLDDVYPAMTDPGAMGPPVPDAGTADAGGDPRIDVYLLDTVPTRERNGRQRPIDGVTIAGLSADGPFAGSTASSYLLLGRGARLGDRNGLRRTLIHELFHSLQYAHNYAIETVEPGFTPWFFEASAAWAEWQYFRAGSGGVHADYFSNGFRAAPDLPLELPAVVAGSNAQQRHPWSAYLWPFFMQQEAGGDPAPVFDAWRAAESAKDWNAFHAAIDAQLPFATSFRDFAVRNLNVDLGPAFEPHYRSLDPNFPADLAPTLSSDFEVTQPGTITMPVGGAEADGLLPLSTQYDLVAVGSQSNTRVLALDFTDIPKGVDVTVLSEATDGAWTRHDLAPGDRLEFDFAAGDAVSRFYVILDNHDREPNWDKPGGGVLAGDYAIDTKS